MRNNEPDVLKRSALTTTNKVKENNVMNLLSAVKKKSED